MASSVHCFFLNGDADGDLDMVERMQRVTRWRGFPAVRSAGAKVVQNGWLSCTLGVPYTAYHIITICIHYQ